MRIVSAIDRPLADEHVIGVDPPLVAQLPGVWRRRINPLAGRSLSDLALTAEQDARAGVQRLRGQSVSAGIVSGLDVMLEPGALGGAPNHARMQILPGLGLARSGEDVVVASPRSIALADLPVRARVDVLDAIASGAPAPAIPPVPAGAGIAVAGVLAGMAAPLPRRLSKPSLGGLIGAAAAAALPRVAVLVAQPVTVTMLAQAADACGPDPRDDPYDDLQRVDGVRLLLDLWPAEMVARAGVSDYSLPAPGPAQRNQLAYRIFDVERLQAPDETHPWEDVGVALALIGFNADWTLAFVDRSSVARLAGMPKPRTPAVAGAGNALLWQAQVSQFSEQMASLSDLAPATLAATFRRLPPVGFLPIDVVELAQHRQNFFSAGWGVTLAPLPLEQADLVAAESAALLPFNLDVIDEAELFVPVPERVYEPGLLQIAGMDPAFDRAVDGAIAARSEWLARREWVRRRRDVLQDAVSGQRPSWPTADVSADEMLPDPAARAPLGCTQIREVAAGANPRTLTMTAAGSSLVFAPGDVFYCWVRIVDAANLTGFSVALGMNTRTAAPDWSHLAFWGAADAAGGAPPANLSAGALPAPSQWTMLRVPADRAWTAANASLVRMSIDGIQLAQHGGTVQWGPIGKLDAAGLDTVWIADEAPPGARLADSANANASVWPSVPAGGGVNPDPPEDDFATVASGGVRTAAEVLALRARWPQDLFANDFRDLDEAGIDGFVQALESRITATNDAVDLGFLKSRANIYRVRQYILGADAASRLVTSPALADTVVRNESARAQSADLSTFAKAAYETDFLRDPSNPLKTAPPGTFEATPAAPGNAPGPIVKPVAKGPDDIRSFTPVAVAVPPVRNFDLTRIARVSPVIGAAAPIATPFAAPIFTPIVTPSATQKVSLAAATTPGTLTLTSAVSALAGAALVHDVQTPVTLTSLAAGLAAQWRGVSIADVRAQLPIAGPIDRTASVAERLTPPPSVDAYSYAIAGKQDVVDALGGLIQTDGSVRPAGIALGDLPAPGFHALKAGDAGPTVAQLLADQQKAADQRAFGDTEAIPDKNGAPARHEADYFTFAVKAIDNSIAMMRLVEARIATYDGLVADARSVRVALTGHIVDADARLRTIDVQVEEARQDLGVASSLRAEEQARVDALNARRHAVLAANANIVLYRRPRRAARMSSVPTVAAASASDAAPIVACNREHPAVPEQIQAYVALLRDAPVSWFPNVHPLVDRIDRLDAVRAALVSVQQRAAAAPVAAASVAASATASKFLLTVGRVMVAQQTALAGRRTQALQLDLGAIASSSLANARRVLIQRGSLADLLAGDHNRAVLSTAVAKEIDQIAAAAACLHAAFGDAPPASRLRWAELLSEFDKPVLLRDLSGLAGWTGLPPDTRRTQQGLVDWLFGRIDASIPAALTAISELVRICLLMAAHAPVERLIPARLVAPAPARPGSVFHVFADSSAVRIGMTALVRDAGGKVLAHAVVEDLSDGVAQSRITQTFGAIDTLTASTRIDLSDRPIALAASLVG
ncbi:hypothetical protein AWB81_05389 [Caballeronia arationis]|uniref:hypothetical protein n=1 Tax=Caballeronia arationis TaxID=1777142 RepID=UPI00074B65C8|nr:hypothetical protein [Caballeronia arationis]SAK96420.1 hypothetical protein AWB81_05389 [Caballeronia arationis]